MKSVIIINLCICSMHLLCSGSALDRTIARLHLLYLMVLSEVNRTRCGSSASLGYHTACRSVTETELVKRRSATGMVLSHKTNSFDENREDSPGQGGEKKFSYSFNLPNNWKSRKDTKSYLVKHTAFLKCTFERGKLSLWQSILLTCS